MLKMIKWWVFFFKILNLFHNALLMKNSSVTLFNQSKIYSWGVVNVDYRTGLHTD